MGYCKPQIPTEYWVTLYQYQCKDCGNNFGTLKSNDIIKYNEVNGTKVRWLPTYGKGGYIDLLMKLVPEYRTKQEVTMQIAKEFDKVLQTHMQKSTSGNPFSSLNITKDICVNCQSSNLTLLREEVLTSPKVEWLQIQCDLL